MHWIAPTPKDLNHRALEEKPREAANLFRADSGLTGRRYSTPVLGKEASILKQAHPTLKIFTEPFP